MAVKIRLKRMGSKKRPFYRIVATDSRNPRDGRFIETLGYYNPIVNPPDINVKEDLVFKWMKRGAIPSENTESLLRRTGTMKKWHLLQQGVSEAELDARVEDLRSKETQPMSEAERKQKHEAKQKVAEAEAPAEAPAEAAAPAETEAAPAEAEAPAKVEAAPEAEAAPEESDAAPAGDEPEKTE